MSISIRSSPVMPSRPCSFCLSLQDGSVFADFDTDKDGLVSLLRISFDGFGCCNIKSPISKMDSEDSRTLLDAISASKIDAEEVEVALQKYFRANTDLIWSDALIEHELI